MNPAAAVTAVPEFPQPHDTGAWLKSTRVWFVQVREKRTEEGYEPAPPKNSPLPHPTWVVDDEGKRGINDGLWDAHSQTERLVYRTLKKIGQKRLGRYTKAKGHEISPHRYHVECSHKEGARLAELSVKTWARTIKSLVEKKSIKYALGVARTRGERETNRDPSAYILEHYDVVLAERKADPNIGVDARKRSWVWNRRNSRKFLTPAEREYWMIPSMPADEDLPAAPEERPARPVRVPASVKQKRTLSKLEVLMQSVLPSDDEEILRVEKLAQDEARKWGEELDEFELHDIVQGMINGQMDRKTREYRIKSGAFFVKNIQGAVRQRLRRRETERQSERARAKEAEKAAVAATRERKERIRVLLRSDDELDRDELAFYREREPDLVREVEASMGGGPPAGGGGSG